MPDSMAAAYEDARAYCQARQQPSAGILKTLLLRRIGRSLHAGLLTAKRLRDGRVSEATREEDEQAEGPDPRDTDSDALARLEQAIQRMEAAGEGDPKLGVLLNYLRSRGWEERGCIMFSQYLDTVLWVAGHLAQAFPKQVGACGPAGWRKSC
jgi:hypothetical protein